LLFHMEQNAVPSPGYQMFSSEPDGGSGGLRVDMETKTAGSAFSVFTNNASYNTITIPAGKWNASLALRSESVATDIQDQNEDMIFHFEDGDGVDPDNSEGDGNRDLEECGVSIYSKEITSGSDDAREIVSSGSVSTGGNDLQMACDGDCSTKHIVGVRFQAVTIDKLEQINSATLQFQSDAGDSATTNLRIYGELPADDDANAFSSTTDNISDRPLTTAYVDWMNIPAWSSSEVGPDTTTPDLTSIIQEIVDRGGWANGNDLVLIIFDHPTSPSTGQREAEAENSEWFRFLLL